MKTIELTRMTWDGRDVGAHLDRAAGDSRQTARLCAPHGRGCAGTGKVIDLAAWRAENLAEPEAPRGEAGTESGLGLYRGRELVRRPRRKYDSALVKGELAATLSVAGLMVAMMIRVLAF